VGLTEGKRVSELNKISVELLNRRRALAQTATTGQDGIATWNYKLSNKVQTGTYSASATASCTSPGGTAQTASSNAVTFTVR
jgi:hypothetical protein